MVAVTDARGETCCRNRARELKKCASWIERLNRKLRDERSAKGTSHQPSSSQMVSKFSTALTKTKHLLGIKPRPKFDLKIANHSLLEQWARECAAEDREHFKHLAISDGGRTKMPCREWTWVDLERWYLETCSMDWVEEFFALRKLIAPRCRVTEVRHSERRSEDVLSKEMIGAYGLGASKSVNSGGRYAVVDQSLFLKVPAVDIGRRASMSR